MDHTISRRSFIKALAVGTAIVGFDPIKRSWVTTAQAAPPDTSIRLPRLDGELVTDEASLAAVADDYGHIISRTPIAVLRPGSASDIMKLMRFARDHDIKVGARGQGHSTYGQGQVAAGVVIDMSTLNKIGQIRHSSVEVGGGTTWRALLEATLPQGYTPPVLTDYLDLSVGGTLAVGGIGGAAQRFGVQVDNVLELTVVTGEGKLRRCSARRDRKLFEAALAGLGQCAIIVCARLKLIAAQTDARVFSLRYSDLATFTEDQQTLIGDGRFDYVEGQVIVSDGIAASYLLEAASFYTPPTLPDNGALLAGLRHDQSTMTFEDKSYFDHLARLDPVVAFLTQIGVWGLPHPWLNIFVPASQVTQYVGNVVANLTLADTGQGPVLIYPVNTERFGRPLFRTPDEPVVFLFSVLRTAFTVEIAEQMVLANRALYEQLRPLGGLRYTIDSVPFSPADWQDHFGPVWEDLMRAKRRYDPDNLLTPGQGIFL